MICSSPNFLIIQHIYNHERQISRVALKNKKCTGMKAPRASGFGASHTVAKSGCGARGLPELGDRGSQSARAAVIKYRSVGTDAYPSEPEAGKSEVQVPSMTQVLVGAISLSEDGHRLAVSFHGGERASSGIASSSCKDTDRIVRVLPWRPHLNLINSPKSPLPNTFTSGVGAST